jgi:Icc-related predicted phosphoesterase
MHKDLFTIAAVGDVHCTRTSRGSLQALFEHAAAQADVLLLCGDLTDYGHLEEATILIQEIPKTIRIPILAVFGNHDFEAGQQDELRKVLVDGGIRVLDGDAFEHEGIGFVGVKGFGGGFGRRTLEPWGEAATKLFVKEGVDEAMKLEVGLARLHTPQKIVLLHYAPIEATVEGEPRETFPFLGSSRLEEPINRYAATAVFHGHAHLGALEGHTHDGIPVYNVSHALLKKHFPNEPAVRFYRMSRKAGKPVSPVPQPA